MFKMESDALGGRDSWTGYTVWKLSTTTVQHVFRDAPIMEAKI